MFLAPGGPLKRLLLAVTLVFAFGGMCAGGTEEPANEDPVVVPVKGDDDAGDDDDDDGDWCCEYKDGEGSTQYALVDGPAECNTKYGDQDGRYVDGNQCIPCCCKTPKDADDAEKGDAYELTTPKSCSGANGECEVADSEHCADGEPKKKQPKQARPRPRPRPTTGKPVGVKPGADPRRKDK
jgi:hypothetical protein